MSSRCPCPTRHVRHGVRSVSAGHAHTRRGDPRTGRASLRTGESPLRLTQYQLHDLGRVRYQCSPATRTARDAGKGGFRIRGERASIGACNQIPLRNARFTLAFQSRDTTQSSRPVAYQSGTPLRFQNTINASPAPLFGFPGVPKRRTERSVISDSPYADLTGIDRIPVLGGIAALTYHARVYTALGPTSGSWQLHSYPGHARLAPR